MTLDAVAMELRELVDATAAEVLPDAHGTEFTESENPSGRQACSSSGDEMREDYWLVFAVEQPQVDDVISDVRAYWVSRGIDLDEADVAPRENAVAARLRGFGVRATAIGPSGDTAVAIAGSTDCFAPT